MQVPAHRLPLLEADGVAALLAVLKDVALPWAVRQHACTALTQAVASASVCAEFVTKCRGLEVVSSGMQQDRGLRTSPSQFLGRY